MKKLFRYCLCLTILASCSLLGINLDRSAAHKAGKYPKFTEKDSLLGFNGAYRNSFDVHFYQLDIAFDIQKKSIKGSVEIYFTALKNMDTIQLNLRDKMKLNEVLFEGSNLSFTRKLDAIFIKFNRTLKEHESISIKLLYEGKPVIAPRPPWNGGFVWKKDKQKNTWAGVACEKIGANIWWPLKDHISDEPDSACLNFTVPIGLTCVSNGKLINKIKNNNQTETFCWKVSYPINTYNITFYIGAFEHFSIPYDEAKAEIMGFYVLKEHLQIAKEHFKQAKEVLQFYEKMFGKYAFWNDGFKLIESPYEGMEHQTAIAYGSGFKNNGLGFDYIILHETAHEWWGNAVSVGDYADIWIHEGIATYSEALFIENKHDYEKAANYLYFYSILIANKKPVVGPIDVNYWDYKDSDPYMKGALMLHSLRGTIGNDSVFYDILRTFYKENTYKIVSSKDFIALVNYKTNSNYDWFFKQFLYNRKPAKFQYRLEIDPLDNTSHVKYKWVDTDSDFKMPIYIRDGSRFIKLYPTSEEQTCELNSIANFSVDLKSFYFTLEKLKN